MNLSPAKDLDPPSPRRADQCSIASTSAAAATTKMIRTCLSLLLMLLQRLRLQLPKLCSFFLFLLVQLLPLGDFKSSAASQRLGHHFLGLRFAGSRLCMMLVFRFPLQYRHTYCCTTHVYQVPLAPPSLFPLLWLKSCCSAACCFGYGYHGGCRH